MAQVAALEAVAGMIAIILYPLLGVLGQKGKVTQVAVDTQTLGLIPVLLAEAAALAL